LGNEFNKTRIINTDKIRQEQRDFDHVTKTDKTKIGDRRIKNMDKTNYKKSQKQIKKLKKKNRKSKGTIVLLLGLLALVLFIGGKGFGLGGGSGLGLGLGFKDSKSQADNELLTVNEKGETDSNAVVIAVKVREIYLNGEKVDSIDALEKKILSMDIDNKQFYLKDVNAIRKEYTQAKDLLNDKGIKFTEIQK